MLVWKQKLTASQEVCKIKARQSDGRGSNRRAIGLVPSPSDETMREVTESERFRYRQVLISIEGKESTCCFKVVSPTRRSRAALVVFRGKVLGCIYGRKDLNYQLFGHDAFEALMDDMASSHSIVDTYILPEKLALATASLFHGSVFNQPENLNCREAFDLMYRHLMESQMPGCIVVKRNNTDEVLGFTYFFAGRVVGVFSYKNGWLGNSYEQALTILDGPTKKFVSGSKLDASSIEEVLELTFSPTGMRYAGNQATTVELTPVDGGYEVLSPQTNQWSAC